VKAVIEVDRRTRHGRRDSATRQIKSKPSHRSRCN
jgi:hypothetical protein